MRKLLFLVLVVSFFSCKKKDNRVKDLIDRIVGTHSTLKICETDSFGIATSIDTVSHNASITLTNGGDSTIIVDGQILYFVGDINTQQYEFETLYGSLTGLHSVNVDPASHRYYYRYYIGTPSPNNSGTDCRYYWDQ